MAANDSDGIGEKLRESFRSAVEADRMRRDLKTALRSGAEEKQMVGGETDGVEEALAALAEKFPDKDRDELLELVEGGDLAGGGAEDVDFEMEGQQGDPASFAGTEKAGATDRVGPGMADEKQGEWEQYEGPEGGRGWRHTRTGEVRYQEEKPEPEPGDEGGGAEEPAEDPVAAATGRMDEHSVLAAMEIEGASQGTGGDEELVDAVVDRYRDISGDEETDRGTVEAVIGALVMPEEEVEGTREEVLERAIRENEDAGGTGVGEGESAPGGATPDELDAELREEQERLRDEMDAAEEGVSGGGGGGEEGGASLESWDDAMQYDEQARLDAMRPEVKREAARDALMEFPHGLEGMLEGMGAEHIPMDRASQVDVAMELAEDTEHGLDQFLYGYAEPWMFEDRYSNPDEVFDPEELAAGEEKAEGEDRRPIQEREADPNEKAAEYIERQRRVLDRDSLSGGLGEAFKARFEGEE